VVASATAPIRLHLQATGKTANQARIAAEPAVAAGGKVGNPKPVRDLRTAAGVVAVHAGYDEAHAPISSA
jgi:hypothetical protein